MPTGVGTSARSVPRSERSGGLEENGERAQAREAGEKERYGTLPPMLSICAARNARSNARL